MSQSEIGSSRASARFDTPVRSLEGSSRSWLSFTHGGSFYFIAVLAFHALMVFAFLASVDGCGTAPVVATVNSTTSDFSVHVQKVGYLPITGN